MYILKHIPAILGCIALFILGMKLLSDGVQNISGLRMRLFLNRLTKKRYSSFFAGLGITSLLQSSSAISVLVLSFVNAGMINLQKAFGIIIGANIGTTITLWLVALGSFGFDLNVFTLPLFFVSVPMYLSSNSQLKNAGLAIIGFSIIFLSLNALKLSIPTDIETDFVKSVLGDFLKIPKYGVLFLAFLVSVVITIFLQSSSASVVLIITFLVNGLTNFEIAMAFVLGANVGTTSSAILASLVGDYYTKAVAQFHLLFNLTGVVLFFFFIPYLSTIFIDFATSFVDFFHFQDNTTAIIKAVGLALFHSTFNIVLALIFIFLLPYITSYYRKKLRGSKLNKKKEALIAGNKMNDEIQVFKANRIAHRFMAKTTQTISNLGKLNTESDFEKFVELCEKIVNNKEEGYFLKKEIKEHFKNLDYNGIGESVVNRKDTLIEVFENLESITGLCNRIAKAHKKRRETNSFITPKLRSYLMKMQEKLELGVTLLVQNIDKKPEQLQIDSVKELEGSINDLFQEAEENLTKSIEKEKLPIQSLLFYKEIIVNYELIGNHLYKASKSLWS